MNKTAIFFVAVVTPVWVSGLASQNVATDRDSHVRRDDERLSFQIVGPWTSRTNLNADAAMIYGVGPTLAADLASWRQHGYKAQVMTGVAWGA